MLSTDEKKYWSLPLREIDKAACEHPKHSYSLVPSSSRDREHDLHRLCGKFTFVFFVPVRKRRETRRKQQTLAIPWSHVGSRTPLSEAVRRKRDEGASRTSNSSIFSREEAEVCFIPHQSIITAIPTQARVEGRQPGFSSTTSAIRRTGWLLVRQNPHGDQQWHRNADSMSYSSSDAPDNAFDPAEESSKDECCESDFKCSDVALSDSDMQGFACVFGEPDDSVRWRQADGPRPSDVAGLFD